MPSKLFSKFQAHIANAGIINIDKLEKLLSVPLITARDYTAIVSAYLTDSNVQVLPSDVAPSLSEKEKINIQQVVIKILLETDKSNEIKIKKWLNTDPNKQTLFQYIEQVTRGAKPVTPPPPPPSPVSPEATADIEEMRRILVEITAAKRQFTALPENNQVNKDKKAAALKQYNEIHGAVTKSLSEAEKKYVALSRKPSAPNALMAEIKQFLVDVKRQEGLYLAMAKTTLTPPPIPTTPPPIPTTPPPMLNPQVDAAITEVNTIMGQLTNIQAQIQKLRDDLPIHLGHEVVDRIQNEQNNVASAIESAQKSLATLYELDKKSATMANVDLTNAINTHSKAVKDALNSATNAHTSATNLSKRLPYIPYKHDETLAAVSKVETDLNAAKQARGDAKHATSDYVMFGTNKRKDTVQADRTVTRLEQELKHAQEDLARWTKALNVYNKEQAIIETQKPIIAQLKQEHEHLTRPLPAPVQPAATIKAKQAELDAARAVSQESQRAIDSLIRSFGGAGNLVGASTLVLERGDNGLGFHSQVVKLNEIQTVMGMTSHTTIASIRVEVATPGADVDLYYLNTPVLKDEAILTAKTYAPGVQGCLVQTKGNIKDQSTGGQALKEHNDELAMQMAVTYILNQKKGKPIIIRGSDNEQIQRVHATLLWMKYQTKDTLAKMCSDVLKGQLPKGTDLDLNRLEITSKCPGPQKGGMFSSQQKQDEAFIAAIMPSLDTKKTLFKGADKALFDQQKQQLMNLKQEHKASQAPKSQTEILIPDESKISKGP